MNSPSALGSSIQLPTLSGSSIWKHLDIDTVKAAFQEATWLARVPEVVADIRRRNEHCIVITMSPNFFASLLLDGGSARLKPHVSPRCRSRATWTPWDSFRKHTNWGEHYSPHEASLDPA